AGDPPTFNNSGTLNPGDGQPLPAGSSLAKVRITAIAGTGLFSVFGNYNQAASGILNLDIAGTTPGSSYDQVNINGLATLNGTLNVRLKPGYVPQPGDTFEIVHYQQRQG